jgi:hypothetical protein
VSVTSSFDLTLESVPAFRLLLAEDRLCVRDNWRVKRV